MQPVERPEARQEGVMEVEIVVRMRGWYLEPIQDEHVPNAKNHVPRQSLKSNDDKGDNSGWLNIMELTFAKMHMNQSTA
jgi:hypothetical protein